MARLKKKNYFLVPLVLFLLLAITIGTSFAQGWKIQEGNVVAQDGNVMVPAEKFIDDDFFTAGDTVTVLGKITGDLFFAGNNLAMQGGLGGDLFAAGREIDVDGSVGGSVRAAGELVDIRGNVTRNALVACRLFSVAPGSSLGGNVLFAGQIFQMDGKVGGTVRGAASTVLIAGEVGRNVEIEADRVVILPGAKIGGNLTYRSENPAEISPGAQIKGVVEQLPVTPKPGKTLASTVLQNVVGWLALLITALIFVLLLPRATARVAEAARTQPWLSLGLGLLGLLIPPFLAILLFVTVIGKVLGWVILIGYGSFMAAGILLGNVFIGLLVGMLVLRAIRKQEQVSAIWSVLIGATILKLLSYIPFVGWLISFFVFILALGALLYIAGQSWLNKKHVHQPPSS